MIRRDAYAGSGEAGVLPGATAAGQSVSEQTDALALMQHLETLSQDNARLRDELGRCYQHLGMVFEITEKIAGQRDPDQIELALIRCYGEMLQAPIVLIVDRQRTRRLDQTQTVIDEPAIVAALQPQIQAASERVRSFCLPGGAAGNEALRGHHALVGTYRTTAGQLAALVALRTPSEMPFDTGDQLVSETVLAYGGHVLSNALMVRRIQQSALETVSALANAVDARDAYTRGHSERVGWLSRRLGEKLGLAETELGYLEWAGILHDVGKIGIAEAVLNKPGRLTEEEFAQVKLHPRLGYDVLRPVSTLEPLLEAVLYHHENFDGSGYPEGIAGETIPLSARILRVVDTFDALTSTRTYRDGMSLERALAVIAEETGQSFDPRISTAFLELIQELARTRPLAFTQRFWQALGERQPDGPPPDAQHVWRAD